MGNVESSSSSSDRKRSKRRGKTTPADVASRAKQVVGESVRDLQANIQTQIKHLEEQDHPAAQFLDTVCGAYMVDDRDEPRRRRSSSFYSEEYNSDEEDERTYSEDETTTTTDYNGKNGKGKGRRRDDPSEAGETASYLGSDYESQDQRAKKKEAASSASFESEDEYSRNGGVGDKSTVVSTAIDEPPKVGGVGSVPPPLASSFAKRCYFTKSGIGSTTQHYEGLTLTGNVVLMLAQAMKLKGCPTICDEDLRRVEQTYPNQFSRLPDELLLSSGWRRISKYCHFSHKPIPDGIPFFHSKQRLHPGGGYFFLLAAAVGMVRPIDVEPLTRDTLVLLETDFPAACDTAPNVLIEDPAEWTLVDKFCFFSGGPINTDEDVYYQADFDGNPIYMLAFLSPSLTPTELYKLDDPDDRGFISVMAVHEVEAVYDLTDRDFDDLRLYHLGPCRALPQYILQPSAWTKVLPPHFLHARDIALQRAEEYEMATYGGVGAGSPDRHEMIDHPPPSSIGHYMPQQHHTHPHHPMNRHHVSSPDGDRMGMQQQIMQSQHMSSMQHRYSHEDDMLPMDEAQESPSRPFMERHTGINPPEDEPPSLTKKGESVEEPPNFARHQAPYQEQHVQRLGYGYDDQHHHSDVHGYESDIVSPSNAPPCDYTIEQEYEVHPKQHQHFSHAEQQPMPYQEQEHLMQSEQRYSSAQRQMHYNDDMQINKSSDQRYSSAQRTNAHFQDEQERFEGNQMDQDGQLIDQHYYRNDRQTMQYHEEHGKAMQHDHGYSSVNDRLRLHEQSEQRHPSAETPRSHYHEETYGIQQPDQRHPSADRSRSHYHEETYGIPQPDQRHPSADRPRSHMHDNTLQLHKRHPSSDQVRLQFQGRHHNGQDDHRPHLEQQNAYYDGAPPAYANDPEYENQNPQYLDGNGGAYYADEKQDAAPGLIDEEPISQHERSLKFDYSVDQTEEHSDIGRSSPQSQALTQGEFSHTSSAMRGARELLKRNRQKRLDLVSRRSQDQSEIVSSNSSPKELPSPHSEVSGGTWESGSVSEATSVVSATSSAWTEHSSAPERSSRRALILQMAKARMKSNPAKGNTMSVNGEHNPEIMGTYSITEEEKKLDGPMDDDQVTEIDIAGDLD